VIDGPLIDCTCDIFSLYEIIDLFLEIVLDQLRFI
jgi:hypothetical protein